MHSTPPRAKVNVSFEKQVKSSEMENNRSSRFEFLSSKNIPFYTMDAEVFKKIQPKAFYGQ